MLSEVSLSHAITEFNSGAMDVATAGERVAYSKKYSRRYSIRKL
jgi:hypothetical protein